MIGTSFTPRSWPWAGTERSRSTFWEGRSCARSGPSSGSHADGSPYGSAAKAEHTALLVDAHQALRSLDFSERQTRALIDRIRPRVGANATLNDVLRMALTVSRVGLEWARA